MARPSLAPLFAAAIVCAAWPRAAAAGAPRPEPDGHRPQAAARAPDFREATQSLQVRLDERLRREALRFTDLSAPGADAPLPGLEFEDDEESRAARSRRVGRLLTRAIRGALDDHLTELARASPAFEGLFRVLDARDADPPRAEAPSAPMRTAGPAPRFDADFRVKIDAHPRLQLRTRLGAVTGLIEIPVLDPELRVGLERPLGRRGRAALRGGWSEERGDWASVAVNFSF